MTASNFTYTKITQEIWERALATIDQMERCRICHGDPSDMEPDKDCMCGGSRTVKGQLAGLEGCIQWWRKLHADKSLKVNQLKQRQQKLVDALKELERQVRISNAVDDHGHKLKNLKALADAAEALREIGEQK